MDKKNHTLFALITLGLALQAFASKPTATLAQVEAHFQKALNMSCTDCHNHKKQKGEIRLDNFSKLTEDEQVSLINRIEEQIYIEKMPPEDDLQPTEEERKDLFSSIKSWNELKGKKSLFRNKLKYPEYGNYVDHAEIFSGKHKDLKGFTYDREWLISEFIFNEKMDALLNITGTKTVDGKKRKIRGNALDLKIANPFLLPKKSGVRYYANERLNSSHFLSMVNNTEYISNSMIGHLSREYEDYLPAVSAVSAMLDKHDAILKSREIYLDAYIDKLCADIYKGGNEVLLPQYTKIKLTSEIKQKTNHFGRHGWKGRVGPDGPLIKSGLTRFGGVSKDKMTIIRRCEQYWFHLGKDKTSIERCLNILRKELATMLKVEELIRPSTVKALSSSEMKVLESTIKKLRVKGMTYGTLKEKSLNQWELEFREIREKSNPLSRKTLEAMLAQLYEKIYQRLPTEKEIRDNGAIAGKYMASVGVNETIRKLTQTLLLDTEFISRNEYGKGKADEHGRKMLSPRDASYSIAYALTDNAPDEQLVKAAQEGKLNTRADYKREIQRLLKDRSHFYIIDNKINSVTGVSNITDLPIRKLRFFREFFGYYSALEVFKDVHRYGGKFGSSRERLIAETDMLVEHILKEDKHVFKELLTTEKFFVFHSGDNKKMLEATQTMREFYDYFVKNNWKSFMTSKDLLPHKKMLKSVKLREKDFTLFINIMCSLQTRFKGNKYIAPTGVVRFWGFGGQERVTSRNRTGMGALDVTKYFNINSARWDYPPVQPAKVENRMGVLTHPSWLQAFSQNDHTDPVIRGKWIREKLLAGKVPDVPITVEAVIPQDHTRTLRTRLASVTEAESCWKCHELMNPLGNAFEMYDDFGRFRTEEELEHPSHILPMIAKKKGPKIHPAQKGQGKSAPGVKHRTYYKTVPLDTTGELEGTGNRKLDGPVKNAHELISKLAKSERVRQSIIRYAFRYFIGRNEMLSDSKTLIEADQAYIKSGGSFDAVIVSLLTSDSFIFRKSPEQNN
jgi:hypothetical protein